MRVSICLSGEAGQGSRFALSLLGKMFVKNGYYAFGYYDYQSLIRGGRNFFILEVSDKEVRSNKEDIDFLLAMNEDAINYHGKKSKYIISDTSLNGNIKENFFEILEKENCERCLNIAMVSFLLGLLKVPYELWYEEIKNLGQDNLKVSKIFYEKGKEKNINFDFPFKFQKSQRYFITGNEAKAIASIASGLNLYIAYPMTPATPIMHFICKYQDESLKVFQAENEIAVINAALGASYAGAKVAVGTSGGGFALMTEALSLAGMSETPIVIFENQRAAPSTGVPTYSMQGDLLFAVFSGHGEFPRVVISPSSIKDEFYLTMKAFDLAYKYQIPVIVLDDKHLGESFLTIEKRAIEKMNLGDNGKFIMSLEEMKKIEDYKRYEITNDGVSKRAVPGYNLIVRATSYEHDEYGYTVEDSESIKKMMEKRLKKLKLLREEAEKDGIEVFGDGNIVLVTFGSTSLVAKDVIEELEKEGVKLKLIVVKFLEPFPVNKFLKEVKDSKIITVECNATGLLARLIEMNCKVEVKDKILKYDARPFTKDELVKEIKKVIKSD